MICNRIATRHSLNYDHSISMQFSASRNHRAAPFARRSVCEARSSNGAIGHGTNTILASASAADIKVALGRELQGTDRGIFGVPAAKKATILGLIGELEAVNPTTHPTRNLEQAAGDWRLLFSTITITGSKKTKLGLREFIKLGDFVQTINIADGSAVNTISFGVTGLTAFKGALTIRASFEVASDSRVNINYLSSSLVPQALQTIFEKNLDLLLSVFNPEGHLDITYLDANTRVGRDNKGNVFLVERCPPPKPRG